MKRLHVHVSVDDLEQSRRFYSTLFAAEPTVVKDDYVKWMLDDPRVNFAISTRAGRTAGISHLGIQAEDETELAEVYERLSRAERPIVEAKNATCCYAQSDKQWIADPQGVPWETFYTYGESTVYGEGSLAKLKEVSEAACCAPSCCEPEAIQARKARAGCRDCLLRSLKGRGSWTSTHKRNWCGRAMAGSPKRRAPRAAAHRHRPAAARPPIRSANRARWAIRMPSSRRCPMAPISALAAAIRRRLRR